MNYILKNNNYILPCTSTYKLNVTNNKNNNFLGTIFTENT